MRKLIALLFAGALFFAGCDDRDKTPDPDPDVKNEKETYLV